MGFFDRRRKKLISIQTESYNPRRIMEEQDFLQYDEELKNEQQRDSYDGGNHSYASQREVLGQPVNNTNNRNIDIVEENHLKQKHFSDDYSQRRNEARIKMESDVINNLQVEVTNQTLKFNGAFSGTLEMRKALRMV